MKKFPSLLAALLLLPAIFLRAEINVVATTADLGSLAQTVGGAHVTVTTLARPTEDPHFVDARPSFIRILHQADLLVEGGAELEQGWLPALVNNARNAKILPGAPGNFRAAAGLQLLEIPAVLDRSQGDVHAFGNPHFLLDPRNASRVAQNLAESLARLDPPHAADYRENAEEFRKMIAEEFPRWQARLAPFKGAPVVTYHKSYDYLLAAFGLELAGTIEPKPGIEPSSAHLETLASDMQARGVKVILAEPNRPDRLCHFLARASGATLLRLPLVPDKSAGCADYRSLVETHVTTLEKTLRSRGK